MNDILRQIILLVMLITLFEQLLPDGKMKQVGKTGLGLVMLLMLVTFMSNALKVTTPSPELAAAHIFRSQAVTDTGSYRDAVLESGARQLSLAATTAASRAGYPRASVTVTLDIDGSVRACHVIEDAVNASRLGASEVPDDLALAIASALGITTDLIFPYGEGGNGHGV